MKIFYLTILVFNIIFAEQKIILNGLKIKNEANPEGDIEIVYRGVGSGEKLHEELLIDGKSEKTDHPLIFKAVENSLDYKRLKDKLDTLDVYIKNNEIKKTIETLSEIIPEWLRE